jgi:hypothetical protein
MWSEAHWKLLDRTFEFLGQVGTKTLYVPLKARTHFGNEHSMVRWIKQADGTWKHDFSIAEKYVDVAVKHLGKIPVVCLAIYDGGTTHQGKAGEPFTVLDEATGVLSEQVAPEWGTAESQAFWKPVIDGMREVLAKRGLEKSMMVGLGQGIYGGTVADLKAVAPDVPWVCHSHLYTERFGAGRGTGSQPVGYNAVVSAAVFAVLWDPEEDQPFYGWRNPFRIVSFPRSEYALLTVEGDLTMYRLCAEGVLLTGTRTRLEGKYNWRLESLAAAVGGKKDFPGIRGLGRLGADFWWVLEGKEGGHAICGRYPGSDWGTLSMTIYNAKTWLLAPGPDGAVSTVRFELMREGLQEAEARIFVQNALLDDALRAKLGKPLADTCEELMNERTHALRYVSEFYDRGDNARHLLTPVWDEMSDKLYTAAAEVAKALR